MRTTKQDNRNMNRSTLLRHLEKGMAHRRSQTLKRRIFDEETEGWRLEWTSNPYSETRVVWVNGNTVSDRGRAEKAREVLRTACLDEVITVLEDQGYVVKRETGCVLVLRRMG